LKAVKIDLDSDEEEHPLTDHVNFLDESIANVEQKEKSKSSVTLFARNENIPSISTKNIKSHQKVVKKYRKTYDKENTKLEPTRKSSQAILQQVQNLPIVKGEPDKKILEYQPKVKEDISEVVQEPQVIKYENSWSQDFLKPRQLEEIQEAELSEFESSTIDERMNSNIAEAQFSESSFATAHKCEAIHAKKIDYENIPVLFIDIKISQNEVSRLVLYRGQTPDEAAKIFIDKHKIPYKLQQYLIDKVKAHYIKVWDGSTYPKPQFDKPYQSMRHLAQSSNYSMPIYSCPRSK